MYYQANKIKSKSSSNKPPSNTQQQRSLMSISKISMMDNMEQKGWETTFNINSVNNTKMENIQQARIHYTINNNIISHPFVKTCTYSQPTNNIMNNQLHM